MDKLIKMIFFRIKDSKGFLITYLVLIPIIILIAIFLTNNMTTKANIAIVGRDDILVESDEINISVIEEVPTDAELVIGKYDAVIVFEGNSYEVITTKGEDVKLAIQDVLEGKEPNWNDESSRAGVTNIFGFTMMVILLLGVQMYAFYFEERKGINKRIVSTNISYLKYILSHFIVVLIFLYVPVAVMVTISIYVFNIVTVLSILQVLAILFVLCFFATSFGMFLNTLVKTFETSMMFGNMTIILTTTISGGFAPVTDNKIFNTITQILPQKQIMDYIIALENNVDTHLWGIAYILGLSIVFIILGAIFEKKLMPTR